MKQKENKMGNKLTQANLINAYKRLRKQNIGCNERIRICGFLEACLINEGFMKPSQTFEYKKSTSGWWIFKTEYKENYPQMIKRLCIEYFEKESIKIPTLDEA